MSRGRIWDIGLAQASYCWGLFFFYLLFIYIIIFSLLFYLISYGYFASLFEIPHISLLKTESSEPVLILLEVSYKLSCNTVVGFFLSRGELFPLSNHSPRSHKNTNVCEFWETGLKILDRVGTYICF